MASASGCGCGAQTAIEPTSIKHAAAIPGASLLIASGRNPILSEQCRHFGLTAPKLNERFERIAAAAARQDAVEKSSRSGPVEGTVLDEGAERVGCQHLGPFVAVVT